MPTGVDAGCSNLAQHACLQILLVLSWINKKYYFHIFSYIDTPTDKFISTDTIYMCLFVDKKISSETYIQQNTLVP